MKAANFPERKNQRRKTALFNLERRYFHPTAAQEKNDTPKRREKRATEIKILQGRVVADEDLARPC